jgi:hypothetical protein
MTYTFNRTQHGSLHNLHCCCIPLHLQVCTATGSTAACRCSAVAALQHILATHGHSPAVKQQLLAADGLSVLVQMLGRDKLPLACRAAAAGCIYHFLAPQGAQQPGNSTAAGTGGTLAGLQKGGQGLERGNNHHTCLW